MMKLSPMIAVLLLAICCRSGSSSKIKSPVLDLNDKFLEVMNNGYWFVKFYAPWCAHCKRLVPTWEHMGHALEDLNSPVRIGKVDCTRFTAACSALRVNAYPTLILFRNGIRIPYDGERKKEAMIDFVLKSSGPVVTPIDTPVKFAEYKKTSDKEPFFVYVDGPKSETGTDKMFEQYEAVAEQLFTEARFTRVSSVNLFPTSVVLHKRPAVIVFKDGKHYVHDEVKNPDLYSWIQAERWPLIPLASAANIHSLGKTDKKLVLIVSDFVDIANTSSETGQFFETAKEAANLVRNDENLADKFQFAWLDGNLIANNIAMMEIPIPDLIVFNQSSYQFYLNSDSPSESTATSIVTFLQTVDEGQIEPMGGRSWAQRVKRMYYDVSTNVYDMFRNQPLLTVCLFGVPLAFFAIITYSICASDFSVDRDEIYPEDDEESEGEATTIEPKMDKTDDRVRRRKRKNSARNDNDSDQSLLGSEDEGDAGNSDAGSDHEKAE